MLTKEVFLQQLSELVSLRTLSGDVETNATALDLIQSWIAPGAKVERFKNGKAEILLASTGENRKPEVGYLIHVDVVAASDALFTMRQENGLLFGRGVSDMKFSIPIGIALLNELLATPNSTSFSVAITTDEEIGGLEGALHLAQVVQWQPKVLLVPDGGDNLKFVNKAKGVAQFEVTLEGKSAHASRPWDGVNVLPDLSTLVVELQKRYGQNSLAENWNTTLNFGQLTGGISTNQVCDSATLRLDFRFPETDSLARIEQEVTELARAINPKIVLRKLSTGLPTFTDPGLPVVQRFLKTLEEEFQQEIPVQPTYGASDARHFAAFNTPVLMIKPMGGDIHMESEWIDLNSSLKFWQALRTFVLETPQAKGKNDTK